LNARVFYPFSLTTCWQYLSFFICQQCELIEREGRPAYRLNQRTEEEVVVVEL
jgi:hypothetical protein